MKKFFTNIPLQKEGQLDKFVYKSRGNARLSMQEPTSFPIIPAISGYVKADEAFRVIAVVQKNDDAKRNCDALEQELRDLCKRKGLSFPENGIEIVQGPETQMVSDNVGTFQSLINYVDDDDELFACVTFGTKPMSMALLMAVRYSYRIKVNTTVSCIVYGEIDRSEGKDRKNWKATIYDETALVQLDEITRVLADRNISNPKSIIDKMINLNN